MMRVLLLITLMISMAVSPAAALASCAAMGGGAAMADMTTAAAGEQKTDMSGMAVDCDSMGDETLPSHDAGCAAACALICPGFYAGPDAPFIHSPAFVVAQYPMPAKDPGLATPSHLDPPPPRL